MRFFQCTTFFFVFDFIRLHLGKLCIFIVLRYLPCKSMTPSIITLPNNSLLGFFVQPWQQLPPQQASDKRFSINSARAELSEDSRDNCFLQLISANFSSITFSKAELRKDSRANTAIANTRKMKSLMIVKEGL